jgi:death-on-curing family protein
MSNKQPTVLELAKEVGLDPELALLSLWEAGLEDIIDPVSRLNRRTAVLARKILCLPTHAQINSFDYWYRQFGLDNDQFAKLLSKLGIRHHPGTRKLPKGAIRILRRALTDQLLIKPPLVEEPKGPAPCISPREPERKKHEADLPPLIWKEIGHQPGQELRLLKADQVVAIHLKLVEDFEGTPDPIRPPGLRSLPLLESAIYRTRTALGGEKKYPTIEMAAAALLHSLVFNHPFVNGNKRTALVCMLAMLDANGIMLICSEAELFKMVIRLAQHKMSDAKDSSLSDRETLGIAEWIARNSRWIEKGERPIPWRRLRRILAFFDCILEFPGSIGNRINITRTITEESGRKKKQRSVQIQVHYRDEGSEVEFDELKHIRRQLELDEEHNVDSACFYGQAPMESEDFIGLYRKILRKLAKL